MPIHPHPFWTLFTRLGEAEILLPAMLAAAVWLAWRSHAPRAAVVWLACTAVVAAVTTATKVAFMGWGIGNAPLNFTGVSGHAMFSASVMPVLARLLVSDASPIVHRCATVLGLAVAALIAYSRVAIYAHSPSEAAAGFVLGAAASALALNGMHIPRFRATVWVPLGLALWLMMMPAGAPPSRTHDWVTQLSLALSGREEPYTRWMMMRAYRQELRERGEPLPPPFRPRVPKAAAG